MPKNVNYPDPSFWTSTSLIQLGYGIWANLAMVVIGFNFGFPAVTVPQLKRPESTFYITIHDESWIASVAPLVSPIGCVLAGYLSDKYGRRFVLIYGQLVCLFGWTWTGMSKSAREMIMARVLTGIGIGTIMGVPRVYTTEISLPNMRGVIGSIPNVAMSVGITIQAAMASLHWSTLCFVCATFSLSLFLCFFLLPETPYFLLKSSTEKAAASLKRLRGKDYNIDAELEELIDFKTGNDIRKLNLKEQIYKLFTRSACRPFWTVTIYFLITQLSGCTIVIMWAIEIIESSKSSVDSQMGYIIQGLTRLFSGLFTSVIIFKTGRRPMALISGLGVGVICVFLSLFIQVHDELTVVPIICYSLYIFFATLGHYNLPALIMFELYPLQIRGLLGGITVSGISFMIFLSNKSFPYVRVLIGFENTILAFGIISLLGCVFLYFFLPETKDLTLQEIEEYYNELRPTLSSQRRLMSLQQLHSTGIQRQSKTTLEDGKGPRQPLDGESLRTYKKDENRG